MSLRMPSINSPPRDDRPAHHVAVPGGVLGQAVQKDVDVEASVVVKARERIVHDGESTRAARMQGQMLDVRDLGDGIGRAFEQHQPGLGPVQHALDACAVFDRQEIVRHANLTSRCCSEIAGGSVRLDESENMVALLAQSQRGGGYGGDAGADQETILPALQLRERLLELSQGRIRRPRIIKSLAVSFQVAQGFVGVVEREFNRLIDRRHQRPIVRRQLDRRRVIDEGVVLHGLPAYGRRANTGGIERVLV